MFSGGESLPCLWLNVVPWEKDGREGKSPGPVLGPVLFGGTQDGETKGIWVTPLSSLPSPAGENLRAPALEATKHDWSGWNGVSPTGHYRPPTLGAGAGASRAGVALNVVGWLAAPPRPLPTGCQTLSSPGVGEGGVGEKPLPPNCACKGL